MLYFKLNVIRVLSLNFMQLLNHEPFNNSTLSLIRLGFKTSDFKIVEQHEGKFKDLLTLKKESLMMQGRRDKSTDQNR